MTVPARQCDNPECEKAKYDKLAKRENSGNYETVEDTGQNGISTRWILWYKGEDIRACLVARGLEEEANFRRDSPTVDRNAVFWPFQPVKTGLSEQLI